MLPHVALSTTLVVREYIVRQSHHGSCSALLELNGQSRASGVQETIAKKRDTFWTHKFVATVRVLRTVQALA